MMTRILLAMIMPLALTASGQSDRVKGWYEIDWITGSTPAALPLVEGRGSRAFDYDTVVRKSGDFSIRYQHRYAPRSSKVGFTPYPFLHWELSPAMTVHLWLKIEASELDPDVRFRIALRDARDNAVFHNLNRSDFRGGEWVRLEIPLRTFSGSGSFDHGQITELYLDTRLPSDARVWFDDVHFFSPGRQGGIFGVTDKTVRQRMMEARLSRNMRAHTVYTSLADDVRPPVLSHLFARFWLAGDLRSANEELVRRLDRQRRELEMNYGFADTWHLFATPWLLRMYLTFGPGDRPTGNRLSEQAQELILEVLWERTKGKNDIHWARHRSSWWMDGSENHDVNMFVANYLSSMIFMDHPDYRDRVFPNRGTGGGPGYWFHRDDGDIRFYGPQGGADLADGKEYVARDHFEAWGNMIRDYMRERARRGFFLEQASPTYMKYTVGFLQDVYEFSIDTDMRGQMRDFLDLVWTSWAVESLHGQRGGAKTRDHLTRRVQQDSMYQMSRFLLGGVIEGAQAYYSLPAMDYELPEIAWHIALNRGALGDFAFLARTIGEEPQDLPREPGLERSLNLDTEHRMFRYSWITPHYIIGAQQDHPLAVHSHLSTASRLYGISFATHPDHRIFPYGVRENESGDWELIPRGGIMYRAVQHKNVLVSQQSRVYLQVNPEWFPQRSLAPIRMGIHFQSTLGNIVERDGWIFVEEGDAFAAIRIVEGAFSAGDGIDDVVSFTEYSASPDLTEPLKTDSYFWNRDRSIAVANNAFSGIIMDMSDRGRHGNFEAFIDDVTGNRLELFKTVVPGWYRLVYEGTSGARIDFNLANNEVPRVDGVPVDYQPDKLFDSPHLESCYESGVIRAVFGELEHVIPFE